MGKKNRKVKVETIMGKKNKKVKVETIMGKKKKKVKVETIMGKKIDLNLKDCTREQCINFAKNVVNDEFDEEEIEDYFEKYGNDYSEEDAINIMKNIVIIWHHLNISCTVCLTYSGRLLLNLTKCIKTGETKNLKILYGLCKSQFNKDQTAFKDDACEEVVAEIEERFIYLDDEEKDDTSELLDTFRELGKKSETLKVYI